MQTPLPIRSRRILLLFLLLLVVPGTPSLHFDGLPFGGRSEVVAFLLFVITAASKSVRIGIRRALTPSRQSWLSLVILFLIFLKIFTFLRFPLGDNFEVCLKSLYRPIADRCEKSFDYLFHSNDGVNGQNDISRVDQTINFRTSTNDEDSRLGASHSTWNLPFQNEYPRFDAPWLNRLPFSAKVGAVINPTNDGLLPIEYVGDIEASTGTTRFADSEYEFRKVALLPVRSGRQELSIKFRFSDDNTEEIPDAPPPARGPYAHLRIGMPIDQVQQSNLRIRVRGHAVNLNRNYPVTRVVIRSSSFEQFATPENRPDLVVFFSRPDFSNSGFNFDIPITTTLRDIPNFEVFAVLNDNTQFRIGTVTAPDFSQVVLAPQTTNVTDSDVQSGFRAWYVFESSPPLLTAEHRIQPSRAAGTIFWLLDLAVVLGLAVLCTTLIRSALRQWRSVGVALLIACGVLLLTEGPAQWLLKPIYQLGTEPLIKALIFVIPLFLFRHRLQEVRMLYVVTLAATTSTATAVEMFRTFTGLSQAPWWGFMVFRDRVIDWFVFQGYAYQILTQQSLRAGESFFYFVPGARYFVFLTHIAFGNNDVLIAILLQFALVGGALWTTSTVLNSTREVGPTTVHATVFGLVIVSLSLNWLTLALATSSTSEAFAWSLLLLVIPIATRLTSSTIFLLLGSCLGLVVFLRPNYLTISVCLLLGILMSTLAQRGGVTSVWLQRGWSLLGFALTVSLALMHNVYYSETFDFFTNRQASGVSVFEPRELFNFFGNSVVRDTVLERFSQYLYWRAPSRDGFQLASWLSQFLAIQALIRLALDRSGTFTRLVLLVSPVLYVVSSAPFGIMTIPERQYTAATLALALGSILSLLVIPEQRTPSNDS